MQTIVWNNEFSVSIQEIDQQHQTILNLINDLTGPIRNNNLEGIKRVADRLIDYTKTHFAIEEALMRMFHYPDYANHKLAHQKLLDRALTFRDQIAKGNTGIGQELQFFLKDWLLGHIQMVDKKYGPYLLDHKIED